MKETTISNHMLAATLGFIFFGGIATILGIYRAAKHIERPLGFVMTENDGDTFVYGAHA